MIQTVTSCVFLQLKVSVCVCADVPKLSEQSHVITSIDADLMFCFLQLKMITEEMNRLKVQAKARTDACTHARTWFKRATSIMNRVIVHVRTQGHKRTRACSHAYTRDVHAHTIACVRTQDAIHLKHA